MRNPRISNRRRRGTAEFEALFAAFFLATILLLGYAAMRISVGRMAAADQAQYLTWHDAYDNQTPQYTTGPLSVPISTGLDTLRPDPLPNRLHVAEGDVTVSYTVLGSNTPTSLTLSEIAMVPGPTWNISATPVVTDQAMLENWFENYANESIGEVAAPLALDPYWYP